MLREQIVKEIMSLVRQKPRKMEKPSIAELEKILNSECTDAINIEPDGSVSITPIVTTVGAVADKVIALLEPEMQKLQEWKALAVGAVAHIEQVEAHCAVRTGTKGVQHAEEGRQLREAGKQMIALARSLTSPSQ